MLIRKGHNLPEMDAFWMPFTANRQFKSAPRMIVAADGMYYTSSNGHQVMDGTAGLWCVNAGHGRRRIADAVAHQLATLDFAPTFQMGHPVAFDFAAQLAAIAPGGPDARLDRIFFTGSGSESVDTSLKIALAYQRGDRPGHAHPPDRPRARLSRRRLRRHFRRRHRQQPPGVSGPCRAPTHLRHTHDPEPATLFVKGQPEHGAELADDLERLGRPAWRGDHRCGHRRACRRLHPAC